MRRPARAVRADCPAPIARISHAYASRERAADRAGLMSAGRPTARQEAFLRAIRDVIADTGDAPTVGEIGQRVGLSNSGSVAYQLGRLEKLGLISRNGRHWRSCQLAGRGRLAPGGCRTARRNLAGQPAAEGAEGGANRLGSCRFSR
ncbi:LexA family transcriptional regulator [Streptomyces sp. NBC_00154]|uniref:LexA family protein n=1 Tax=Streptomyces sp. NBC_00154 TaxID=2975670 RepID=UPI00225056A9|nr:hypothetical protein [Streptomyces sp. NBC_00154]MCX5315826.1 hypothetical protein [Streptomyces sp. NBC_00154]